MRELQNAVERAIILSQGGPIRFESYSSPIEPMRGAPSDPGDQPRFLTREQLKRREKESIIAALRQSHGRIFGPGGAAELLGMKPTTLASRINALRISRSTVIGS